MLVARARPELDHAAVYPRGAFKTLSTVVVRVMPPISRPPGVTMERFISEPDREHTMPKKDGCGRRATVTRSAGSMSSFLGVPGIGANSSEQSRWLTGPVTRSTSEQFLRWPAGRNWSAKSAP